MGHAGGVFHPPEVQQASIRPFLELLLDSVLATGLPCSSNGKESACQPRGQGSIPGLGSPSGEGSEGNGNPLQYSCRENSMDRGAWRVTVHGCRESDTTEQLTQPTGAVLGTGSMVKEMDINKNKFIWLPRVSGASCWIFRWRTQAPERRL